MSGGRVFLVEDDPNTLNATTRVLRANGFEVLAFPSAEEFLLHHDGNIPGCAVFDVALGDANGLDMHRDLIMHGCARPTIFITGRADVATSVQAMKGGALDFLIKPVQEAELVTAVSKAIEHDRYAREEDARLHDVRTRIASLTPKQREVLVHIVAGRRNREIAAEMHISEKTVKIHRSQVLAKLNARSNVDLARLLYGRSLDEAETLSDVLLKIGNGLITL